MSSLKIPKSQSALLIVDMQNGFIHPESGMGKSPSGTQTQQNIVPAVCTLVNLFHSHASPVIWSKQEHFPEDQTRTQRTIQPHSAKQGFLPCLRGTWETDLYGELNDLCQSDDHVVVKHRASVFYNTNLETKLRMLSTRFLFIAGCNTEFCVESTVRDAYARDFEIIVVRECVAGIQPRFHENSLNVIQAYFAEVLTLDQVRSALT